MEKKVFNINVLDILQLIVAAAFLLGAIFVFAPCGPKEDGGWMACHWAGNVSVGLAAVLTVIAVLRLILADNGVKGGLSLATVVLAVFAALVPDRVVSLCMMETMRCHTVTAPAVTVCAIVIAAVAAGDAVRRLTALKRAER